LGRAVAEGGEAGGERLSVSNISSIHLEASDASRVAAGALLPTTFNISGPRAHFVADFVPWLAGAFKSFHV